MDREESDEISLGFRVHKTKDSLTFELWDVWCVGKDPLDSIQWFTDIYEHDLCRDISQLEEIKLFGDAHKYKDEELVRVRGCCIDGIDGYYGFRVDHISSLQGN